MNASFKVYGEEFGIVQADSFFGKITNKDQKNHKSLDQSTSQSSPNRRKDSFSKRYLPIEF